MLPGKLSTPACLAAALALWAVPTSSRAALPGDSVEISMYGRAGVAWGLNGQVIQGHSMNLLGNSIGGRFEEGDYLEPTIKFHILKSEDATAPYVEAVLTPAMFAKNGSFLGVFSNSFEDTLRIELFQAYVEAGNMLLPDLKVWAGARFYRGADVHIADYFYFNNLSGQGAGAKYKDLDVAVLVHTGAQGQYSFDTTGDTVADARRQRTVAVAQYIKPFGDSFIHVLGEFHYLPTGRTADGTQVLPADTGWVLGIKGRLALPNEGWNDLAVRYGSGIANGGHGGSQTWNTFGLADLSGTYSGSSGLAVVDHLLVNISPKVAVNAYGVLNYNVGSGGAEDKGLDFAVGARSFLYLFDQFQLINELTYQGRQDGTTPLATATKFSIVPTIVPSGKHSVWARPHLRLIYTLAVYNKSAVDHLYSPYLQLLGPSSVGHFFGTKVEWWF